MAENEPTMTKLEPTLTSLRELSKAFPDSSRMAALLLDAADVIEWLESENANMRDELDEMDSELDEWKKKVLFFKQLADINESDNFKLRELLRDMFRDFANADYQLKSNCGKTFMAVTRYEPRLQELGIEVSA